MRYIGSIIFLFFINSCANAELNIEKCKLYDGGDLSPDRIYEYPLSQYMPILAFIVPEKSGYEVITDPIWSIKIDKIIADDQEVKRCPSFAILESDQLRKSALKNTLILTTPLSKKVFFHSGMQLYEYTIKPKPSKIEIYYRIQYFDGSVNEKTYLMRSITEKPLKFESTTK